MRHGERGTRNNQPGQDLSDLDYALETLLAGSLPEEDQSGLQPVADLLTALRQPAAPAELTGQASALAEFRARPRRTAVVTWGWRHGGPARGRWLRPRPATALAAGAVVVAGLAAGAYEGDLPAPVQRLWHNTIGLTAVQSKAPHRPADPGRTGRTGPSPTPSQHRAPGPGRAAAAQPGRQRGDGHPGADRDGQRSADQSRHQNSPSPSHPSSWPSPSPLATEPSTAPAAQPSPQSSSSAGPHHPDGSPSSSP